MQLRSIAVILAVSIAAAWIGAAPAAAHSELIGSNPAADTALEYAPIGVELTFNQNISASFATITLVGPDGEQWAKGATTVEGPAVTVLTADGLPNGRYTVGYRVTSADGHPITGSYGFTLTAAAGPTSGAPDTTGQPPQTSTPAAAPAYDPNNPAASEGDRPATQNRTFLLSTVAVVVLALGAIGLTLVRRGRKEQ